MEGATLSVRVAWEERVMEGATLSDEVVMGVEVVEGVALCDEVGKGEEEMEGATLPVRETRGDEEAEAMAVGREEEEKVRLQHENTLKLKKIQYQEGLLANRRKVEARIIELEQAKILQSMGNQDDDKFAEICRAEIARYAAEGKPVYTLMRALETTQPALLPAKKADKPAQKKRDK